MPTTSETTALETATKTTAVTTNEDGSRRAAESEKLISDYLRKSNSPLILGAKVAFVITITAIALKQFNVF